ncbi:DUF6804 family protein [Stenotrophomonas indicatrix]|uniref:DUF6804 family protein n=1 Tax=Stenotrophomonas indicatrix TaxID=2045451 RepID=UPI003D16E792
MPKVLWLVAALLALAMIPTMPYGFYPIMRWIVCAGCAWMALMSYRRLREGWAWCFGALAGIYNPIVPIHASREVWTVVNVLTLVVIFIYGLKVPADRES